MLSYKSKFSIFCLFSLLCMNAHALFTDMECLNSNFTSVVSHKAMPLGLSETILKVTKDNCLVVIEHSELKFLKNKWAIDVCREPIHIKSGTSSIDVLKKTAACNAPKHNKDFCEATKKIELVLQDDGLIFADGEKEDLNADHGRLYCTFLLMKSYLRNDLVYSRQGHYENTLMDSSIFKNKKETCPIPQKNEKVSTESEREIAVPQIQLNEDIPETTQTTDMPTMDSSQDSSNPIPESSEEGRF